MRHSLLVLAAGGLLATAIPVHAASPSDLARQQGCLGCHAVASRQVGPAYEEVAAKYKDQPDALKTLIEHIRAGGSGRWGDIPMPPQTQLTPAQAKTLAAWILGGAN